MLGVCEKEMLLGEQNDDCIFSYEYVFNNDNQMYLKLYCDQSIFIFLYPRYICLDEFIILIILVFK